MKKISTIFSLFLLFLLTQPAKAALTAGSIAPDWTFTAIDGRSYHLYAILDSGYNVIIDVSAVWCGPCWAYHNSGNLEALYDDYGPKGTNDIRVFYIEGDGNPLSELQGVGATQGDWTAGTPYPMILTDPTVNSSGLSKMSAYNITYFPTIYKICAKDHKIYEVGQITESQLVDELALCPAPFTHDAALVSYDGDANLCSLSDGIPGKVTIKNKGSNLLTSAMVRAYDGATEIGAYSWGGTLSYGATASVDLGILPVSGANPIEFRITTTDDNAVDDKWVQPIEFGSAAHTAVYLEMHTDANSSSENSWTLKKSDGTVVQSEPGATAFINDHTYTWNMILDPNECYSFTFNDLGGDGLTGTGYWTFLNSSDNSLIMNGSTMSETSVLKKMTTGEADGINGGYSSTVDCALQPNPAVNETDLQLFIHQTSPLRLTLVNTLGEAVKEWDLGLQNPGEFHTKLDIQSLPNGSYVLQITEGDRQIQSHLVIQH